MEPSKFLGFTDLLATVISILIGISLAISAILSTRSRVSNSISSLEDERLRISKLADIDDAKLLGGQAIIFWFYYISLILAVLLKYLGIEYGSVDSPDPIIFKVISSLFASISCLSLLWSATLPSLLKGINSQRLELENN